jgi:hypothetical protein
MNLNPSTGDSRARKNGQRTLDLPAPLLEELKSEAARLGRSLSSVVQMAWRISVGRPPDPPAPAPQPWEPVAAELSRQLRNPSKRRAASRAWLHFERWCAERGYPSLPCKDETLLAYAADRLARGASPNEVVRAAAAVSLVHRVRGRQAPRLRPSAQKAVQRLLSDLRTPRLKAAL